MLAESDAVFVMVVGEQGEIADGGLPVLKVDPATGGIAGDRDLTTPQLPTLGPDDPAYIFFTSGTSGQPKGILGLHKGLAHFLHWQSTTFAIGPQDRAAQLTALSFDVVLRDIFTPLTSGASLCLPADETDLAPDRLWGWLARERITLLHTVPSLMQHWLNGTAEANGLPDLRWVFVAGEPLTESLVRRWRAAQPASRLVNLYGPTETTLAKCCYVVPPDPAPGIQPVGRPLPDTQVWILNTAGQLCGPGELGEIVIRTPFRTRGYLTPAVDEHKRFAPNPFCTDANDRVYYTGDQGRYRTDGLIEILGRRDHQVKIRGVRVEPDEASAVLSRHPQVKACVVVAHKPAHVEPRLVAYVVASPALDPAALKQYLSLSLPGVMIPAQFVFLDHLPLTLNGKVDRRALPAPVLQAASPAVFVPPQSDAEILLARVWAEVLNLEQVSVHANFFEIGGDSISALQVVSRARREGVTLSARQLFQRQTIAELAPVLALAAPPADAAARPGVAEGEAPFPLAGLSLQDLDDLIADLNESEP
jgi:amino acid adenylation domain-containing protein